MVLSVGVGPSYMQSSCQLRVDIFFFAEFLSVLIHIGSYLQPIGTKLR